MPTIISDADVFEREVGCSPHWSRSDSGREPKTFVYPSQFRPERRHVSPRPSGPLAPPVTSTSTAAGVTPSQWLRQWCCLDEQT